MGVLYLDGHVGAYHGGSDLPRLQRVPREVPSHGTAVEMCSPYTPLLSWDDAIR